MARILMNLLLMQKGYPPVVIRLGERDDYLLSLREADRMTTPVRQQGDRVMVNLRLRKTGLAVVDRLAEALEAYESAVRLQPDHWRAMKGIGVVLDRLGRPEEATAAYQRAREAQRR